MSNKKAEIVYLDINDLGVDVCNIRKGLWNNDEEMVISVKMQGILEPLIVRDADPSTGKKYGIVAGNRRYHAAKEAGLSELPCIIKELNNAEALACSMAENRHRSNTPVWMDIEVVGSVWHHKDFWGISPNEKIKKLGLSQPTVDRYRRIFLLREEVKGLLRKHDERTKYIQKSYLEQRFPWWDTSQVLPVGHANLLTELIDSPLEKQVEAGIYIIGFTEKEAEEFIQIVKLYPDKDIKDIYNEHNGKLNGVHQVTLKFDVAEWGAIEKACRAKKKPYRPLCKDVLLDYLRERNFLVEEIKEVPQQRGLKDYTGDLVPDCDSVVSDSHA